MTNIQFAKGINIKSVNTQYGEIIKVGINTSVLFDNPIEETGWLNLDFKKSKNGKWYAVINDYQKKSAPLSVSGQKNIVDFDEIDEDEIPF